MSRYLDISKLADEVVASVATQATEKTASVVNEETRSELGRALKLAAESLRNTGPNAVSSADIHAVLKGARKYAEAQPTTGSTLGALSGSPAGAAMGGGLSSPINSSAPGPAPSNPTGQMAPKLGSSEAGNELRKLAAVLRERGVQDEESRTIKAAQMSNAATGIAHLTAELSR